MASDAQVQTQAAQLPAQKFSRYRSVRQANATRQTNFSPPPFESTLPTKETPVTRSKSRYHRKPNPVQVPLVPPQQLRQQPQARLQTQQQPHLQNRPTRVLHSHSASLAALTGEPVEDAQRPPIPKLVNSESKKEAPHVATKKSTSSRPSQPSAAQSSEYFGAGYPRQTPHITNNIVSEPITPDEDYARKEARDILQAEDRRLRRLKAQQDAAREFERSRRQTVQMNQPSKSMEDDGLVRRTTAPELQGESRTQNSPRERPSIGAFGRMMRKSSSKDMTGFADPASPTGPVQSPPMRQEATNDNQEIASQGRTSSTQKLSLRQRLRATSRATKVPVNESLSSVAATSTQTWSSPPKPAAANPVIFDAPISAVNAGNRRVVVKYNGSFVTLPVTPTTTSQDLLHSASICMSEAIDPRQSVLFESFSQLGLERPLRMYEHVRDAMNSWDHDDQNDFMIMPKSAVLTDNLESKHVPKNSPDEVKVYIYHSQKPRKWDKRWVTLKPDGQISTSKRQNGSDSSNICHLSDFDIYMPTLRQLKKIKSPKKTCFAIKSQQKSAVFLSGANFVHFFATSDKSTATMWYSAVQTWRSWYLVNVLGEGQKNAQKQPPNESVRPGTSGSVNSIPYQLGSFKPLLDFDPTVGARATSSEQHFVPTHSRTLSTRHRNAPPSSFPNGLQQSDGPTETSRGRAPSLSRGNGRTNSIRSNSERPTEPRRSTSMKRTGSVRQMPKPLIDLTPQFHEAPQHIKKGRGVPAEPGKTLVELATDVEAVPGAVVLPAARTWRRPQTADTGARPSCDMQRPLPDDAAFTGAGLLAKSKSKRAQGGTGRGHGVKTGDRNVLGQPLMDLKPTSQFADGSLLRQIEAHQGADEWAPVVDREKRIEADVKVGEGV